MSGRLFIIPTYNSLIIKLLAAEIVSAHNLTATRFPAQAMSAVLNDTELLDTLSQILSAEEYLSRREFTVLLKKQYLDGTWT